MFFGLLIWLEFDEPLTLLALLIPHVVMVVVVVYTWYMVELINPEDMSSKPGGEQLDPGMRVVCFEESTITTRYCATCRKQVHGLDHVRTCQSMHTT